MKGVVFNIFEDFISDGWGDAAWEALLGSCPRHASGPYVGPGTYHDADLAALLEGACTRFDITSADALRAFGRYMLPALVGRYPAFIEAHDAPKDFLLSVESVIHSEVRKLYRDTRLPSFTYHDTGADELRIDYRSPRRLCHLFEGLIDGVSRHYGVPIRQRQTGCMHHGADCCSFELQFGARSSGV